MRKPQYIYHLVDQSGATIYVGRSSDPQVRLKQHRRAGIVADVRVVAACGDDPPAEEMAEIKRCAAARCPLLNHRGVREPLLPNMFVRLTEKLEAVVEAHRQNLEKERGKRVDFSKAIRSLLDAGIQARGIRV